MRIKTVSTLAFAALMSSCASSSVRVTSSPETAEVSYVRMNGTSTKIGVTPLTLTSESFPDAFGNHLQLTVSKDGYAMQSFLIPKVSFQSQSQVHALLKESKLPDSCSNQDKSMNELAQGIAESQRLLMKKNYSESAHMLGNLISRFPNVATLHFLIGNSHYLAKDSHSALESYKRARELQPNNPEATRMIERLEQIRPTRSFTGEGN
ncbi:MAG: hypothetical protein ACO3A2_11310 [Bdellovibrionia bacterium]